MAVTIAASRGTPNPLEHREITTPPPLAHPAFGALLAVQLRQLWQLMDAPDPFYVVELGAGNGLLCRDILAAAAAMPDNLPLNMPDGFARCLRYLCLDRRSASPGYEPAPARRYPHCNFGYTFAQPARLYHLQRTTRRLSRPPGETRKR